MKYSMIIAALASVAFGVSLREHQEFVKRQAAGGSVQNTVPANVAAMTDANGNVLQFDAANVYLDGQAKGI